MKKQFEYLFFDSTNMTNEDVQNRMNDIGENRWELVSVADYMVDGCSKRRTFYFKRRIK